MSELSPEGWRKKYYESAAANITGDTAKEEKLRSYLLTPKVQELIESHPKESDHLMNAIQGAMKKGTPGDKRIDATDRYRRDTSEVAGLIRTLEALTARIPGLEAALEKSSELKVIVEK